MRRRERVFASLAVFFAFVGMCGLILLSIFDTKRFTKQHRIFLLVFIVGVGMSAIFTVIEASSCMRTSEKTRRRAHVLCPTVPLAQP